MKKISDYYKVGKAAEFLGISQSTLRSWGKKGHIKELRDPASNARLYRLEDLEDALNTIEYKKNDI